MILSIYHLGATVGTHIGPGGRGLIFREINIYATDVKKVISSIFIYTID